MKKDEMKITVLEDGTIKMETDGVSQANHMSADQFQAFCSRLAGGATEIIRKRAGHTHHHHTGEEHAGH